MRKILLFLMALCIHTTVFAQATQSLTGYVFDDASKAPLADVVISLLGRGTNEIAVTDSNGRFRLDGLPLGRQSFKVSRPGYEDRVATDVIITAGKEATINVGLQESLRKLDEVVVRHSRSKDKTRTNNDMALVSARSFNVDETKRYAGALGDPSRMASNFAGVVSGNDSRNDIVVRGNSPAGMLWQLDGLNIPNPNHYGSLSSTGGPVSMLNNNVLDKSDFMTSAFPAQYGNATAGVFDLKLRDGNRSKREFVAQMGFNGFELGAEGPLGKMASYLVNYRYSTLGVFQKLGINFGTGNATPIYQDLNYRVTGRIGKKGKLTAFGIIGNSHIDFLGKDVDTGSNELFGGDPFYNERSRYLTTITGLSYEHQLSDKTFSKLTLGYCTTLEHYDADSISIQDGGEIADYRLHSTTNKLSAVWMLLHKFSARDNLQAGATYDHTSFGLLSKDFEEGKLKEIQTDQDGSFGLAQGYVQWKHRFSSGLSAVGGVHGQYFTLNGTSAIEPRASLRYAINRMHAVSIGYGLHAQTQGIYTYLLQTQLPDGIAYTNKNLGFTRSNHTVLTYDLNLTRHLRIKTELYYQRLTDVPIEMVSSSFSVLNTGASYGPANTDSLVNRGKGYNYGTELTIERFFNKGYYFLITGSLFQSRYEGSDGIERNTGFNTGHVLNVLAGKEFRLGTKGSVLALNLKLCSVGGGYTTPLDLERSRAEGRTIFQDDKAYSQRRPAYFRPDVRIAYRREMRRSTLEVALDLQNVTNHQNLFSEYYDSRRGEVVKTYQQSFFPVPTIRWTF